MTDRLKGVIVTFDRDIRDDDAESITKAIRHIRSVADVQPIVAEHTDLMARIRVRHEMHAKLHQAIDAILFEKAEP